MAAPAENSLSPKDQTRIRESTLTKQRELCVNQSKVMHLQQHLQHLKNRERQAQLHNKQLLQQFERAQDTLKEVLAQNAAMKIIRVQKHKDRLENIHRMEYERYLEENAPRWQQQLQEKTRAVQKKRLQDSLRSFLKKTEEKQVLMSRTDGPSQVSTTETPECAAPQTCSQENLDSNRDSFSYCPYTQSHPGQFPGVLKVPHLSHTPLLSPPHSFLLHHLTSTPGHHHPWSELDAVGWNNLGPGASGIPPGCLDQPFREEPPALRVSQTSGEEIKTSGSQVSNKEKDGGSRSCLSSDLDVKPVRLPSDHADSSESSTDSSRTCRRKRKKRGITQPSSSERCGSLKSSSKMIPSLFALRQSSETNTSSEAGSSRGSRRTERSGSDGSPKSEKRVEEQSRRESQYAADEEEEGMTEKVENESRDSCGTEEGSGSNGVKIQTCDKEATQHQERRNSEQSSVGEKDEEHRKGNVKRGDEDESCDVETDTENSSDEEEDEKEEQEDEEESEKLKNKYTEIRKEASSQDDDEDGSEGSEKVEEEEEGSNEEEAVESGESEDIIIFPQEKRLKQMKMIPEEAAEDDEAKTQSSNESSDEDIENLLAPQEQTKNADKDVKVDRKLKETRHNMDIFQVSEEKWKTAQKIDSDEFDHFYD